MEEHQRVTYDILKLLADAGLRLDIDKCEFDTTRVKYLGLIMDTHEGISMDPEKVAAIRDWEALTTVRGVRGFIGFANYYRDFIQDFSEITMLLTALTKKDTDFNWTVECDNAFKELKERFLSGPALANWNPDAETRIECDASGFTISGTYSQRTSPDEPWRPVAFYSRKMTPAETNYSIYDKELLAIIIATDR